MVEEGGEIRGNVAASPVVTIRKTIDMLTATSCVESDYALLYSDRDFDPFVEHLGLSSAMS